MSATAAPKRPDQGPRLRSVALPAEHGGWGLTLEPGLLGLLVAPSSAGFAIALAAMVAFLARTPVKLALVDRRRGRVLDRTRLATRVALAELAVLATLVLIAVTTAGAPFWAPLVVAAPLIGVEAWYDVRSRGRRLVPEVAGAVAVCSVAPMIVLADGGSAGPAYGLWLVLAARVATSIPHVRDRVAELHGRPEVPRQSVVADGIAVALAAMAVGVDPQLLAGALAVGAVIVIQRASALRPTPPAVVLGMRQLGLGLAVVVVTTLGVILTSG